MRKLYILIAIFFLLLTNNTVVKAQYIPVSPSQFTEWMYNNYPGSIYYDNGTGYLDTTNVAMRSATSVTLTGLTYDGFGDVILYMQYFVSCTSLQCVYNNGVIMGGTFPPNLIQLSYIGSGDVMPSLPSTLQSLTCTGNQWLSSLPPLPASLRYLRCTGNHLSSVNIAGTQVDTLICGSQFDYAPLDHILTSIVLNNSLKYLDCSNGRLSGLPALPNTLRYLNCVGQLYHTNPEDVQLILGSLPPLPDSLRTLICGYNALTSLPDLPAHLTYLDCSNTKATNPGGAVIGTGITSLPKLPNGLQTLSCSSCDLHCLPHLPASLQSLNYAWNDILCLPNSGNYVLAGSSTTLPLCTALNNPYECESNPVVTGRLYYDNNSNGMKDAGENYKSNVKVYLSNGNIAYSNDDGYFAVVADSGNNVLHIVSPTYYNAVPSSINYSFTSFDTVAYDLIALQPTANVDSLTISIVPLYDPVPGEPFSYAIRFENLGTTTLSPNLVLNYDNNRLHFVSGPPGAVNNGNTVSFSTSNFTPADIDWANMHFTVDAGASMGDMLYATATITASSAVATATDSSVILSSYDPNDKKATTNLSLQEVSSGKYIEYLIRFQNTGTTTARNIRITDDLSTLLNTSTVQIQSASHLCNVKQQGRKLTFKFDNINLPDMNSNEPASHGFIKFRVKPNSNVATGANIPNNASIYFDFNSPVVTNTATTHILSIVPLHLVSFNGYYNSTNKNAQLSWKTTNETNTYSFDIERSIDGINFEKNGNILSYSYENHTYSYETKMRTPIEYYRLKMIDIDGKFSYSNVIKLKMPKPGEYYSILNNPARGTITIEVYDGSLQNTIAIITNSTGQVVQRLVLKTGIQYIDTGKLSPGIYYLQTSKGSSKIIIQ
ncbi:MAG: T9SS type A sorting domain-containing protein [Ferruginibacter sp.]